MTNIRIPLDYKEHTNRAVHDLSQVVRTSLYLGQLTPVLFIPMYAGDKFHIRIPNIRINSLPLATPLLGNFRLRHEIVFEPNSNLYGFLDNNDKKSTEFFLDTSHKNRFKTPNFILDTETANDTLGQYTGIGLADVQLFSFLTTASNGDSVEVSEDVDYSNFYKTYLQRMGSLIPLVAMMDSFGDSVPQEIYSDFVSRLTDDGLLDPETVFNVRPGSLADYMGIPSGFSSFISTGNVNPNPYFSLDYILTYLDYWRSYHRNTQEKKIPFCPGMYFRDSRNPNVYRQYNFDDEDSLDKLFRNLHATQNGITVDAANYQIAWPNDTDEVALAPTEVDWQNDFLEYMRCIYSPNGGLLPTTYMPDIWRNILASDPNAVKSKVTVTDGQFSIEELRYANRLQQIIDRFTVSGGRFSNWLKTLFGVKPRRTLDIPDLVGVRTDWVGTTTVTNVAQTPDSPLGAVGAKVDSTFGSKQKYTVSADQNGILMVCVSIVPEVDYFQNILPQATVTEFTDEYFPQLANRGFDNLSTLSFNALPGFLEGDVKYGGVPYVVGRQVSWITDMSRVNRLHGEFATHGIYNNMALGRTYQRVVDTEEQYFLGVRNQNGDVEKPIPAWLYQGGQRYAEDTWNSQPYSVRFDLAYDAMLRLPQWTSYTEFSTYVNPLDYQHVFESDGLSAPPFMYQAVFDIKAIRPIGRRFMPTLE